MFNFEKQFKVSQSKSFFGQNFSVHSGRSTNGLDQAHLLQSVSILSASTCCIDILDNSSFLQITNNPSLNQKICNNSSKRNNISLVLGILQFEFFSRVPHMIPRVVENDERKIHLLFITNKIHNVLLILVDIVGGNSCL